MLNFLRHVIGCWLLEKALRILPRQSSEWRGSARGLREQALYDRYVAYAQIIGAAPLRIESWREEMGWIHRKFRSQKILTSAGEFDGEAMLLS